MAKLGTSSNDNRLVSASGIAALCIAAGLLLLFILPRDNPQIERLRLAAFDVLMPVIDTLGAPFIALRDTGKSIDRLGDLSALNDELQAENEVLRQQIAELTQSKVLMQQYRKLLALPTEPQFDLLPLRVVADLSSPFVKTLIANGGRNLDIQPGLAVMGTNGLIGRVISVGETSSRILLVTDFNSNVPVVALAGDVQAILSGRNNQRPFLQYIPPKATLKTGDLLVTSGRGGQVPVGLPVGTVAQRKDGEPFAVQLMDDIASLNYVRVVKMKPLEMPPQASGPILGNLSTAERRGQ